MTLLLPTCSVPAMMSVLPAYELFAAKITVPDPCLISKPLPMMGLASVVEALFVLTVSEFAEYVSMVEPPLVASEAIEMEPGVATAVPNSFNVLKLVTLTVSL